MKVFGLKTRSLIVTAMVSLTISGNAQAAGFALIEGNATGQGNAYAGAAAHTNNASTIFFNPAGMMNLDGEQIVLAAHFIEPSSDFTNNGSSLSPSGPAGFLSGPDDDGGLGAFVPNFYWVKPLDDDMTFGLGVNSPFGLATEYDDGWVGRYHALLSDLKIVNFNPSLAYRVNDKISIGGGVNWMLAVVDLTSAIDFGALGGTPQAADGLAELDGDNFDDFSLGFNFGLSYMASSQTTYGIAYRSRVTIGVEGDADFTVPTGVPLPPGNFVDTGISAEVSLPASFSFSVAHNVDKITWLADVTWTGWSSFDELRIEYDNPNQPDSVTTEDWDGTFRYSLGFDHQTTDKLVLRAGLALDETPVPSAERRTPRLPGNDRTWLSLGFSYMAAKMVSIDFGYSHLFIDDAEVDNEFESSVPTLQHQLVGEYEAEVDIISAQLNWTLE